MTISLIVPLHRDNAGSRAALAGFAALNPAPCQLIAVLDGANAELEEAAANLGFHVLILPRRSGPTAARNAGARDASGEVLLFVDSDVVTPLGLIQTLRNAFELHPEAAAVFGSYDDAPGDGGFLSQYKNLQHHFVHQTAHSDASTFWTGCGAVRKKYFEELNGFDSRITRTCIEDVEFGIRLKNAGHRIHLEKTLQVKHLKRYTALSLIHSDFFDRALPWSRLILQQGQMPDDLNVSWKNRWSVLAAYGFLGSLLASILTRTPWVLWLAALCAIALLWLNADFYRFLRRKRGFLFFLKSLPWHGFYFLYSGLGFACALAERGAKSIFKTFTRKKLTSKTTYENTL